VAASSKGRTTAPRSARALLSLPGVA
jgi:hypothetical protein